MKECDYYDCDDSTERLQHEDKDEAIEAHLDDQVELPEEITIYGYERTKVNLERFTNIILENASEYLSENFDGEDGHDQNEAIREAGRKFAEVYLDNYTPWNCNQVSEEKINVRQWCEKHRPDYLKEV